jgi:hypothetical protein
MSVRLSVAGLLATSAFAVGAQSALAWTPAQNAAFAKKLAVSITPAFKKQAPTLVLGAVTCVLPAEGTVVKCKAHFSDKPDNANILYLISADLKDSGAIKWTTTAHSCTNAKTGKKLPC